MTGRLALVLPALLGTVTLASQQPVFRAAVAGVEVDVAVMRRNQPVQGLASADFVVTDNGVRQQVTATRLTDLPIHVALVLDVSASVSGSRLESLIRAGQRLAAALKVDDRSSLITFSHEIQRPLPMGASGNQLSRALSTLSGAGLTALRDALHLSLMSGLNDRSRSLVLLFSDGRDTASWLSEDEVLAAARRSHAVIHVVRAGNDPFLERIAEVSGGRTWSARSDRQLEELFTQALQEMRARYLLTYTPAGESTAGWHAIDVSLANGSADLSFRPGYFVR